MNSKRVTGIVIAIIGVAMLFFSNYIKGQVAEGREKISSAQSSVDKGNSLFNLNPITKEVGKGLTGSAQRKIDEGSAEADQYAQYAQWLLIGGIVLIVVGIGAVIFSRKKQ